MNNQPSEALQWMESNLEEALMYPDEAFDWVFMLKDEDWRLLSVIYKTKSELWREACAYVFSEGPVKESKDIMLLALSDKCKRVREQAAETICHHLREYLRAFTHMELYNNEKGGSK